jgi:hemerythrin-like domain-containing protein
MASPANLLHPAPAPSFDDPIGMLLACHVRMRRQLGTLERLQRHVPVYGADAEAQAAASAIIRYFDQAAVNHHADEDQSLLPRLVERAPQLAPAAARITVEHRDLELLWRKIRGLLSGIAVGRNEGLPPGLVHDVCNAYLAHIDHEEAHILPVASERLTEADLADMGREFAARRGQSYDPSHTTVAPR